MAVGLANRDVRLPAWWPLAALLVAGALLRLAATYAQSVLPLFEHHRLDALVYHEAGRAVAAGDWAIGDGVLHMSPGYSYFVGLVYTCFGDGPWPIRIAQIALGLATVALVYGAALLLWSDRRWATAAAAISALYGPFVFYELHLVAATLAVFAHALVVYLALRAMARPASLAAWAAVGTAWGLAVLVRPTALLFGAPLAAAVYAATRGAALRARAARLAILLVAAGGLIAPVTIRNAVIGGELVLVTDSGGLNFYLGNGPGAIGTFRIPRDMPDATNAVAQFRAFEAVAARELARPVSSREVNAYWYGKAWDEIRARPSRWARLLLEKAWLFWNARELPNTHDYAFHREINPVLSLPLVQFAWLSPLALLGVIALTVRRRAPEIFVAGMIAVQLIAMIAFFVLSHYRLPAVPALILAALAGVRTFVDAVRTRRVRALAWCAPVLIAAIPIVFASKLPRPLDDEYFKLGYAYHVQRDLDAAEASYLRALAINEDNASAHKNLARLYEARGEIGRARAHWRRVATIGRRRGSTRHVDEAQRALARLSGGPALEHGEAAGAANDAGDGDPAVLEQ